MNTQRYQLRLSGLPEPTGQIKAASLCRILDALLQTGERATRLIVTGQSSGRGRKPKWLRASANFTVTGLNSGSTILEIEAPRFRETAYGELSQQELWHDKPSLDDTSLDMAARAIEEATSAESPGDHFDSDVLKAILKFNSAAGTPGIRYELIPQGSTGSGFVLDEHVCTQVSERLRSIPPPRSFIVTGRLDEIRYGGGRFRLLLGRNGQLLGKLHPDLLDTEVLRPLWGNPTTVEGLVHFKANGEARWIEARRMSGRAEGDRVFEESPSGKGGESLGPVTAQRKRNVRSTDPMILAGAWPGDEPIDELLSQLD
ncbi:MAG: hypothetical protein OXT71_20685 [Acidobacteriota bacterium]|nr:hypothetical protein [Acidobacteriota bacterium]